MPQADDKNDNLEDLSPFVGADGFDEDDAALEEAKRELAEMEAAAAAEGDQEGEGELTTSEEDLKSDPDSKTDNPEKEEESAEEPETPDENKDSGSKEEPKDVDDPEAQEPAKTTETPEQKAAREKHIRIPKTRFDREAQKRRLAEERVQELQEKLRTATAQQGKPTKEVDIKEVGARMQDAILDGKPEEFANMLGDLLSDRDRQVEDRIMQRIPDLATKAVAKDTHQSQLESVINDLESKFEFLSPDSDDYDDDFVGTVLGIQSSYIARGVAPGEAMNQAFSKTLKIERPELFNEHYGDKPNEEMAKAEQQKTAAQNKQKNLKEKVEAASKQPPMPKTGKGNKSSEEPTIDLDNLTDEELDALPAATLKRLRGDAF